MHKSYLQKTDRCQGRAKWFLSALFLLLWQTATYAQAQQISSKPAPIIQAQHYGIDDGLSHRHVTSVHQDSTGFLWLGTKYGLNRFDGYRFQWFTEEKHGLQSNEIDHILADVKGRLWLFNTGSHLLQNVKSIDLFDPVSHEVQSVQEAFGASLPFDPKGVVCFARNQLGHLAFLTAKKLVLYDGGFKVFPVGRPDLQKAQFMYFADDGYIWIVSQIFGEHWTKLFILDGQGQVRQEILHEPNTYTVVHELGENGEGKYINLLMQGSLKQAAPAFLKIDADGQLSEDIPTKQVFSKYGIIHDYQGYILKKIQSYIWTFTANSEFLLVPEDGGRPTNISKDYPELKNTTCIFADRDGAVWLGTHFGLYHFKLKAPKFRTHLHNKIQDETKLPFSMRCLKITEQGPSRQLWGMVEHHGKLWKVDLTTGLESEFMAMNSGRWALAQTNSGELLFVGPRDLYRIRASDGQLVEKYAFNSNKYTYSVWFIHEDKHGKIWFDDAFLGKLYYFQNGRQNSIENWAGDGETIYTYQFLEDGTDTAWVATSRGLFRLNIQNGQVVQRFWEGGQGKYRLPFDHVHHFTQAENGTFWLGTSGGGLLNWHPEQGIIERITRADGLPNNTIYAVYPDEHGNFWLPTDHGIAVVDRTSKRVRAYSVKDGLSHNEFNRISHCSDRAGNFYFGTLNGVTSFHPDDFVADTTAFHPPLVITNFQQFDEATNQLVDKTADLSRSRTITMRPDDNLLHLEFSLLAFEDMENVQYAYRLEGVDPEWTYQKENTVRLSRLPYGDHVLAIKGQTADGMWSDQVLRLHVRVVKPFYLHIWFIMLAIAGVLGGSFFFSRQRVRGLKARQAELERVVKERTAIEEQQKAELQALDVVKSRFFANISHELRTPLTLMIGPIRSLLKENQLTAKQAGLLQMADRSGRQLQELVNEILDLRKLEMGKMEQHLQATDVSTFFGRYAAQFESLAGRQGVGYDFQAPGSGHYVALIDREKCRQILYNLLSNAFKFTPEGGQVNVELSVRNGTLQLEVADTGPGIHHDDLPNIFNRFFQTNRPDQPAEGGTGIGLALCYEYAKLFDGEISVESQLGKGSTFRVTIPVEMVEAPDEAGANTSPPSIQKAITAVATAALKLTNGVPSPPGDMPTLLVVEDNPELQDYIRLVLQGRYNVLTAGNGQEALEVLQASVGEGERTSGLRAADCGAVDLIISDLMMPVMDGYQLLAKLKADEATRQLPVIMLTARAEKDDRLKALRIGVDDYLTKPFDEEELLVRIENLLANHAVRQQATAEPVLPEEAPSLSLPDQEWLENFEAFVRDNLSNSALTVTSLAQEFAMSESTLFRQVSRLTGLSPKSYLQEVRLDAARHMLENREYRSISRVAAEVGYGNARTFARRFRERYGKLPFEYLND